ncbi:MAG: putative porin [Flavobacteriales bacterium]
MPIVFGDLMTNLGNLGLPEYSLFYNQRILHAAGVVIPYNKDSIKYYHTRKPFTYAHYTQGTALEQTIDLWHTQNISPLFNMTAAFKRLGNPGMYLNQEVINNRFFVSGIFGNDTNRMRFDFFYRRDVWDNSFNGGLVADSVFEQNLLPANNPKLYEFNLNDVRARTLSHELGFNLQYVVKNVRESLKIVWHQTYRWDNSSWQYRENIPIENFYFNDFHNSSDTIKDGFQFVSSQITQGISLENKERLKVKVSIGNQWGSYLNRLNDTVFIAPYIDLAFYYFTEKWQLLISDRLFVYGFNAMKQDATINSTYLIDEKWTINFKGYYNSLNPGINHLRYNSSRFIWKDNTYDVSQYGLTGRILRKEKIYAELGQHTLINPIYFNNVGNRAQEETKTHVSSFLLGGDLTSKRFGFFYKAIYQYVGGYQILPLPDFVAQVGLYSDMSLFKQALKFRPGISIKYWNEYYAPGFIPATGFYHIQREKRLGNYPFVDAFVLFNIKTVNLYFMMSHINSGLIGNTYFDALHYPSRQRAFRLGLNWNFWN